MGRPQRQSIEIDGVPHFKCTGQCQRLLPATKDHFRKSVHPWCRSGFHSQCWKCERVYRASRRKANRGAAPYGRHAYLIQQQAERDGNFQKRLAARGWAKAGAA